MPSLSISLIIILLTCVVSFTAFGNQESLYKLSLQPYMVKHYNQYYRFFSSGFVHADFGHLFFNMLKLYFFGSFVEQIFVYLLGSKTLYIVYYILGIIVANLPSYFKHRNNPDYSSLGASGAISAVVFTSILVEPWAKISIFFAIPMPAVVYGALFLIISAYLSRKGGGNINHDAHLWGALFGLIFPLLVRPELGTEFLFKLTHH